MSDEFEKLKDWIGRKESHDDLATAWPVTAMTATLDRTDPVVRDGEDIPLGWHWLYFLEAKPAAELGPDGHPKRGGFLPPVSLPRRMWAGGRIEFTRPLKVGEKIRRESEILSVQPKSGKTGNLVFVTVRHTVSGSGSVAVVEEHDIVYRDAAKPTDAAPVGKPAPATAAWTRRLQPSTTLLFRFSALTFNGHRIHYDLDYCKTEEHYPGLVVHGPLQTLLMLDICRRNSARPVKKLDYRAMHPVFHQDAFTVNGNPSADGAKADLWTANHAGNFAMAGTATF